MIQEKHDDCVLVRFTTEDGETAELWLPPVLAIFCGSYCPKGFDDVPYSARVLWMKDQNSRAWDMSA